jgi:hypothetical protein
MPFPMLLQPFLPRHILAQEGIYIPAITTLHGTDITLVGKDPAYGPIITYSINPKRWGNNS